MKIGKTTQIAFTIAISALTLFVGSTASAAPAAAPAVTEASIAKDLALLENRFFSHQYANDPTDKRLERLELLVYGATQGGSLPERWARLNKSIATRSQTPIAKSAPSSGEKAPESSTQYPVLNTLEWRALKQTYPKESLDQRLGRMEKKLFGQDAPGMAYVDRVDRLKKTLGIGITAAAPSGPTGPAPKARPRSMGGIQDFSDFNFGGDDGLMSPMAPFAFGFGNSAMNGAFAQMFADMNKQMAEMEKLGPGSWVFDPKTGMWVEQFTGKQVKPDGTPGPKSFAPKAAPKRVLPAPRQFNFNFGTGRDTTNALPPYTDPNSI